MTRPEIHITHIGYCQVPSVKDVQKVAHATAEGLEMQVFRATTHLGWEELDHFGIVQALVYGDDMIETWVRQKTHWEVAITKFTFTVPIIN